MGDRIHRRNAPPRPRCGGEVRALREDAAGTRCLRGVDGVINFRDLGGLPLAPRARTRRGLLFRTASLAALDAAEAAALLERVPLRSYVDLRTDAEVAREGPPRSLMERDVRWIQRPLDSRGTFLDGAGRPMPSDYASAYLGILRPTAEAACAVIALSAREGATPIAVGCTAGKDRTGLLSALVLGYLGVDDAAIARDYALSARLLRPHVDRFRSHWEKRAISRASYAIRLETVPCTMRTCLCSLRQRFGSVARVLEDAGLDACSGRAFRERMLAGRDGP